MNRIFNLTVFLFGALLAVPAHAQLPAKNIPQLLKASLTANKSLGTATALSPAQLHMLDSQFSALEETRRALLQNPGWAVSANFAQTAQYLKDLGLPLPPQPAPTSSSEEKTRYLQQLNALLYQESNALAPLVNHRPRPLTPPNRFEWMPDKLLKNQALSQEKWEQILKIGSPAFSFGTPNWDEVHISPAEEFSNPQSSLYADPDILRSIITNTRIPTQDMYDLILTEKSFSPQTRQALICAIEEAASVLTHNFTRIYMYAFGSIPSVRYISGSVPQRNAALATYAKTVQNRLINKLEEKGRWSERDFDLFAQVSVFLEPQRARAVLGAVTYLEPQAARWLLNHSLTDKFSQRILSKLQETRDQQSTIWPDGNLTPKQPIHLPFKRLEYERIQSLKSYNIVLAKRLQALMNLEYGVRKAKEILKASASNPGEPAERLSAEIYVKAREARLQKLINETRAQVVNIESEIFHSSNK